MMTTPGERMIHIRKRLGLSQQEFAEQLGITQGALSHIETNRTKLSVDLASSVCRQYSVSSEWLLLNRGSLDHVPMQTAFASLPYKEETRIILINQDAHADYPSHYKDEKYLTGLGTYRLPGFEQGSFRMFEISGDSMEPTLYSNEIVVVERVNKLEEINNGNVYVVITEKGILAKRLFLYENGHDVLVLKSDNEKYEDFTLRAKDVFEIWAIRAKLTREFLDNDPAKTKSFSDLENRVKRLESLFGKNMLKPDGNSGNNHS